MGYIYLRTNKINGKKYVGQTKDIEKRNRKWNCLNYRYGGYVINNARAKYGVDGFSFEILKECEDKDMNYWEMYYIKMYNSKTPNGYNMTDGGDSSYEMTDEIRKKISEARRGKHYPKISAAKRGKKHTAEAKAKMSAAHRGMKQLPETIEKRAAKLRDKPKPKVAAALRGRKRPAEVVAKVAAANKNNPKKSKPVQALDKDGNVVMEFASTREAGRQGFDSGSISHCCLGKVKTHKGYIWRYAV